MTDRKALNSSGRQDVQAFLKDVRALASPKDNASSGRLVFALDATASREASWDKASALHAEMFQAASACGGLQVQLCYYRGFQEFRATKWFDSAHLLLGAMTSVRCAAGRTQIGRVLTLIEAEHKAQKVAAAVIISDAFEESLDRAAHTAGNLGLRGCKLFLFQDGHDRAASRAFAELARLSGGACCQFDETSADELRELLRAVAAYAAGGHEAARAMLQNGRTQAARRLTQQLKP